MQVGNARYIKPGDVPATLAVFPLAGALLLPGGQLPLNVFEPRYLALIDQALAGNRLVGIIQPALGEAGSEESLQERVDVCQVGCIGRITSYAETGDGRYIISLGGICRFRVLDEVAGNKPFRVFQIAPFIADLACEDEEDQVDRAGLLGAFRAYLEANNLEADWDSVERARNMTLVNSLAMMSPFGAAEKQALLEAPDLKTRAQTLIAITEIVLARQFGDCQRVMQ